MAGPSFFSTPKTTVTDIAELLGPLKASIKTLENLCETHPTPDNEHNKPALDALKACDNQISQTLDPTPAGPKL